KSGPGPRLNKIWEPFCKDFPFTVRIATGELAHSEEELDTAARTGCVTQGSLIMAMNGGGNFRTQGTTGGGCRGSDLDHQAGFGDLDLFNLHSFRQSKQGSPFHRNLTVCER